MSKFSVCSFTNRTETINLRVCVVCVCVCVTHIGMPFFQPIFCLAKAKARRHKLFILEGKQNKVVA